MANDCIFAGTFLTVVPMISFWPLLLSVEYTIYGQYWVVTYILAPFCVSELKAYPPLPFGYVELQCILTRVCACLAGRRLHLDVGVGLLGALARVGDMPRWQ